MSSASQTTKLTPPTDQLPSPTESSSGLKNNTFLQAIYYVLLLLSSSYVLNQVISHLVHHVGYEDGVYLLRLGFTTLNLIQVTIWVKLLAARAENMRAHEEHEIKALEEMLEKIKTLVEEVKDITAAVNKNRYGYGAMEIDEEDRVVDDSEEESEGSVISVGGGGFYAFS